MSTGKEQQQCLAAAMCLQAAAAAPIHAARILPSFLNSLQHHASPHQCQMFPPSQPLGCLIWLVVCHPTKQKWPLQRPWVPTAMWERTASTKDRPLCAGTTMGDGDSPGCPSRLSDAPGSRLSHWGCRSHTLPCAWDRFRQQKGALLSFFTHYSITSPLLIPSQIFTDVTPDCTWTIICPRWTNWIPSSCACVEIPAFTCFLGFYHNLFLVTGSIQAGGFQLWWSLPQAPNWKALWEYTCLTLEIALLSQLSTDSKGGWRSAVSKWFMCLLTTQIALDLKVSMVALGAAQGWLTCSSMVLSHSLIKAQNKTRIYF